MTMCARVLTEVVVAHWTGDGRELSSVQNGFSIGAKTGMKYNKLAEPLCTRK